MQNRHNDSRFHNNPSPYVTDYNLPHPATPSPVPPLHPTHPHTLLVYWNQGQMSLRHRCCWTEILVKICITRMSQCGIPSCVGKDKNSININICSHQTIFYFVPSSAHNVLSTDAAMQLLADNNQCTLAHLFPRHRLKRHNDIVGSSVCAMTSEMPVPQFCCSTRVGVGVWVVVFCLFDCLFCWAY